MNERVRRIGGGTLGFAIELTGTLAKQYTIHYEAKLSGKKKVVTAKNGEICGTDKDGGKAIEHFKIWIEEK